MATSGVMTFRLNRDQIITQSLIKVGGLDPESAVGPSATQITNAAINLNAMVKVWETKGLELWERKYAVIFPQKGQGIYALGTPGPGGDHATLSNNLNVGSFLNTTLPSTVTVGSSTITLSTITDNGTVGTAAYTILSGDNIGIEADDGTMYWFTVNGAPSGNTVTLNIPTTVNSSAGNTVYAYRTKLFRPLRVLAGFYRQAAGNDVPIRIISRDEYNLFGVKTSTGVPIQAFYDPQTNTGLLEIYPQPVDVDGQLYIEIQKPIEDFVTSTDDFDFPQEWCEALIWGLARRLIPDYRTPPQTASLIVQMAKESEDTVTAWDQENTSMFLQPDESMYMNLRGNR